MRYLLIIFIFVGYLHYVQTFSQEVNHQLEQLKAVYSDPVEHSTAFAAATSQ